MKIVIDRNIRGAEETFGHHGELVPMDGRAIRKHHLVNADVLVIRTATRANAQLLEGTPVRFVGTTSIGTDHIDIPWLEAQGIRWSNAPGCNADSAAQYTLAMIWLACRRLGRDLVNQRVGIIGRGNVGSRLQRLLDAIGVETVANDPPLADLGVKNLVPQAEALACDIVSLHVPLSREGPYPTVGMIGAKQLDRMPKGGLLVNAARGDVVDEAALLDAVVEGRVHAALDVWPEEPQLNPELLKSAVVATPHVAGYSNDGKRNGTFMVYDAFCEWSGEDSYSRGQDPGRQSMTVDNPGRALEQVLEATCFVERHDRAMRELVGLEPDRIAPAFDRLRKDYPYRRDFHAWDLHCDDPATATLLGKLGFEVNNT